MTKRSRKNSTHHAHHSKHHSKSSGSTKCDIPYLLCLVVIGLGCAGLIGGVVSAAILKGKYNDLSRHGTAANWSSTECTVLRFDLTRSTATFCSSKCRVRDAARWAYEVLLHDQNVTAGAFRDFGEPILDAWPNNIGIAESANATEGEVHSCRVHRNIPIDQLISYDELKRFKARQVDSLKLVVLLDVPDAAFVDDESYATTTICTIVFWSVCGFACLLYAIACLVDGCSNRSAKAKARKAQADEVVSKLKHDQTVPPEWTVAPELPPDPPAETDNALAAAEAADAADDTKSTETN
jgi:hypothetical protein